MPTWVGESTHRIEGISIGVDYPHALPILHFDKEEPWLDSAKASGSGRCQGGKE